MKINPDSIIRKSACNRLGRIFRGAWVLSGALLAASVSAQTWIGGPNGDFSNPANWLGGVAPVNNGTASVTFTGAGTPVNVVLDTDYSVQTVTTTGSSIFGLFGSRTLTLTNSFQASANAVLSSLVQVVLGGGGVAFNVDPSKEVDLVGAVSGGPLVKTGAGTLVLIPYQQTNTYTGGTTISGGMVTVRVDTDLGNLSGGITFGGTGGTLAINQGYGNSPAYPSGVYGRNVVFNPGATGTITSADANTWTGSLSGSGNFIKAGTGNLTLTATNPLSGTTVVSGGTLVVDGSLPNSPVTVNGTLSGSGSFGQAVTVNGTLMGNGSFAGPVTVNGLLTGAGSFAAPVSVGSGGRIAAFGGSFSQLVTLGAGGRFSGSGTTVFPNGLSLAATSLLDFRLGTNTDEFVITGGVLSGPVTGKITLNLAAGAGYTPGIYTLFDFSSGASTSSFDASDFALGTLLQGSTAANYSLGIVGNKLQLTSTALGIPEPSTWAAIAGVAVLGFAVMRRRVAVR